jgi:Aspartyl protease
MPRLVALAVFLSAGIGWIDGYNIDHIDSRKGSHRNNSGRDGINLSDQGNTAASLGDSESLEMDFSDDECFQFEPLQILCEVNGFIIPAIVDTGAQVTVMSESCARRCRVANQIDGRFSGKAVGIGSSDILGRINQLGMRVGPISYNSKVSILRQSRVDLIIGLDFLRRFGAEISLERRLLKLNVRGKTVRIPFIPDSARFFGSPSKKSISADDRDQVKCRNDRYGELDEDGEYYDEKNESERSETSPASDYTEMEDLMEQRRMAGNKGKANGKSNTQSSTRTSSSYEKNKREFVILSSKLNRNFHYNSDEDHDHDDDEDDNHVIKSFVSMEGV